MAEKNVKADDQLDDIIEDKEPKLNIPQKLPILLPIRSRWNTPTWSPGSCPGTRGLPSKRSSSMLRRRTARCGKCLRTQNNK